MCNGSYGEIIAFHRGKHSLHGKSVHENPAHLMFSGCIKHLFCSTQRRIKRCGTTGGREQKVALDFEINFQLQQGTQFSYRTVYSVYHLDPAHSGIAEGNQTQD